MHMVMAAGSNFAFKIGAKPLQIETYRRIAETVRDNRPRLLLITNRKLHKLS